MKALDAALADCATMFRRLRYIPFRAQENVQLRHEHMVALRAENYTLTEIADILGLVNHTSVLHHLNGKCRCPDGELAAGEIREVEAGAEDRGPAPLGVSMPELQGCNTPRRMEGP
jgi:hypothetical protein